VEAGDHQKQHTAAQMMVLLETLRKAKQHELNIVGCKQIFLNNLKEADRINDQDNKVESLRKLMTAL
jgi:hypothetical protein